MSVRIACSSMIGLLMMSQSSVVFVLLDFKLESSRRFWVDVAKVKSNILNTSNVLQLIVALKPIVILH